MGFLSPLPLCSKGSFMCEEVLTYGHAPAWANNVVFINKIFQENKWCMGEYMQLLTWSGWSTWLDLGAMFAATGQISKRFWVMVFMSYCSDFLFFSLKTALWTGRSQSVRYPLLFADVCCRTVTEKSSCVLQAFQAMFGVQHIWLVQDQTNHKLVLSCFLSIHLFLLKPPCMSPLGRVGKQTEQSCYPRVKCSQTKGSVGCELNNSHGSK